MSLFSATFIPGIFLLILGGILLWKGKKAGGAFKLFPRSKRAAYVSLGLAAVWTLYHISQLGEADMGNYKKPLFVGFAALAVLAFKYAPDFLSVRGRMFFYPQLICITNLLSGYSWFILFIWEFFFLSIWRLCRFV
jgi:hypothetical protein